MLQNYIVASYTIKWSAAAVFRACSRQLPASDNSLAALSKPVHCTAGQRISFHALFSLTMRRRRRRRLLLLLVFV